MYISRVRLSGTAAQSPVFWRMGMVGYRPHQVVWRWLADHPTRTRDFLFRVDGVGKNQRFTVVSSRIPKDPDGIWVIETKDYRPVLSNGEQLGFSLRVNPVITRKSSSGKGRRHDIVMDWRKQNVELEAIKSRDEFIRDAALSWLSKRATQSGFVFVNSMVRVNGYERHVFHKRKASNPVRLSTVDFVGQLQVVDTDRFTPALLQGLGPAKAFGCGLLLVRRM